MRVRAKKIGFYNHIRVRRGQVFDLSSPDHFSEVWMEKPISKKPVVEEVFEEEVLEDEEFPEDEEVI